MNWNELFRILEKKRASERENERPPFVFSPRFTSRHSISAKITEFSNNIAHLSGPPPLHDCFFIPFGLLDNFRVMDDVLAIPKNRKHAKNSFKKYVGGVGRGAVPGRKRQRASALGNWEASLKPAAATNSGRGGEELDGKPHTRWTACTGPRYSMTLGIGNRAWRG